ncbi:hypothetical protein BDM02DRAFT_3182909 [Thelephora ganbajun]|uniref:Uncharacterized protein n=1 Tax=Thelephora ganbajun TaxID=370292 RepID=A0ACB6ZVG8_THEGA|nr:hypothetical protein BDM02DRAFT_3182909 [Thelephora ganbajun]
MYDEIVPDSEPEREEQRRYLNEERRLKRARKRQTPESTRSMSFVLSSSPEPDLRLPSLLSKEALPKQSDVGSVISISDDPSSEVEMFAPKFGSTATNPEPGSSRLPPPRKHPTPVSNASSSELTTSDRSLSSSDLSRYSYMPPQSLRDMIKKRGELEAQRTAQFGPPEPLRKSKVARPAAHRFAADFTDEDLSRVLKCVSCNDRWTVRKGAAAKMRHIQSCAKKNGIGDEIVKRLIQAELEVPEEPKPRQKPKSSGVTNTLLEDTLWDTGKTKNKKKQVQRTTTLHNPAENREAILAKARSLLREPEISNLSQDEGLMDLLRKSDSTMDRIQMFDFDAPPPATQEFGRSKLGQKTSSAMLSVLPDDSPKMSTTSRLADTANKGRCLDLFTGEEVDTRSPISIHSSIDVSFERLSLEPLDFHKGDAQSDHDTEVSWRNDSGILHYNQREDDLIWDSDERIHDHTTIHFNPNREDRPLPQKPLLPLHTPVPTYTSSATRNSMQLTPQGPTRQGKERKAAKSRSRTKEADVRSNNTTQLIEMVDAELKSKMLNVIREDDELYHRILRYDPIPLEIFLALAVTLDLPTRGLQSKVTKFLDEQAVHFQAPTSGSRR